MFTFAATPVKFVGLLILFAWCTIWCVYELTRPQDTRRRVSNALHLVMAVVMLLMVMRPVWSAFVMVFPMPLVVGFFALATAWFVGLAIVTARSADRRFLRHYAGHAAMFAAMVWHLAAMAVKRPHMTPSTGSGMGHDLGPTMGPDMAAWMAAESVPGGILWVFALVGVPFMTYLLAASVLDLRSALRPRAAVNNACACGTGCTCGPECACGPAHVQLEHVSRELAMASAGPGASTGAVTSPAPVTAGCHEERPVGSPLFRASALADFAMNFGMFWMSTGLMTALLPFFSVLAF
ncbi:MAG: DUF5134 domain-containing protein [Propionicimonas sp.]